LSSDNKKNKKKPFKLEKSVLKKKNKDSLKDKIKSLEQKLGQALEDKLYLQADFENFKKRASEERTNLIRYDGQRLLFSLADEVLDDLDRAMQTAEAEKSFDNLKKGLDMIQKKISKTLDHFGVKALDPTGEAFDPSYQEALSHVETDEFPEGYVAKTFKKAYKLHDKVIRPAQVIIAKKKQDKI